MEKIVESIQDRIECFEQLGDLEDLMIKAKKTISLEDVIKAMTEELFIQLIQESILIEYEEYEIAILNQKQIAKTIDVFTYYLDTEKKTKAEILEMLLEVENDHRDIIKTLTLNDKIELINNAE